MFAKIEHLSSRLSLNQNYLLTLIAIALVFIGIINFAVFIGDSDKLGGDALNGYVKNEKYYVANHGVYTEVSEEEWHSSRKHAISVFITHPFAGLGGFFLIFRLHQLMSVYKKENNQA